MYMAGGDFGKFYVNDDIHWQYCAPKPPETGRKRTSRVITTGCSILLADGEGFEPPKVLFHTLSDFKSDAFNRSANHPELMFYDGII